MSSVQNGRPTTKSMLGNLFAPIANELAEVDCRLQSELRHSNSVLDELAQHAFRLGGKRLRPALLLLSAQSVGKLNDAHRLLAVVVEMIHTATLVHDDVLDEATLRRHHETINARWNNQTSILLGDFLFSHAFYLSSTLETTFGSRTIGQSTNVVCSGELRQTASSGHFDLTRQEYLEIIDSKTAELTACCCKLGAYYAGGEPAIVKSLESYGRCLGMAFQIADDILDLEGDEAFAGKSLGTDLEHLKMTLPIIQLRDQLDPSERQELEKLLSTSGSLAKNRLMDWLESSGALQDTREASREYSMKAIDSLAHLSASPAKATLEKLAFLVANRDS